jgi:6-phosphogluconolactonase (cycloisomerase 2 family)
MWNFDSSMRAACLVALAAALIFASGCGGGGSTSIVTPVTYAYAATAGFNYTATGAVTQFKVASNGTLSPLSPEALTSYSVFTTVALDPSGRYLYAGVMYYGDVAGIRQFVVGSDGTIVPNSIPEVSADAYPVAITFTPNGQFAMVTNGLTLSSYSIGPAGTLTLIGKVSTGENSANTIAIDPSGRFLYVANSPYDSTISQYTISASGSLTFANTIAVGHTSPVPILISPRGFLYSADGETGTVSEYSINPSDGSLAMVNSVPSGSGGPSGADNASWPCSLAFSPTGTHAYVSNCLDSTISIFAVDASTGTFTRNGPDVPLSLPFNSQLEARNISVDPSGRFLFGACDNGDVVGFTIDSSGMLTSSGTISLANYGGPVGIVFAQR